MNRFADKIDFAGHARSSDNYGRDNDNVVQCFVATKLTQQAADKPRVEAVSKLRSRLVIAFATHPREFFVSAVRFANLAQNNRCTCVTLAPVKEQSATVSIDQLTYVIVRVHSNFTFRLEYSWENRDRQENKF